MTFRRRIRHWTGWRRASCPECTEKQLSTVRNGTTRRRLFFYTVLQSSQFLSPCLPRSIPNYNTSKAFLLHSAPDLSLQTRNRRSRKRRERRSHSWDVRSCVYANSLSTVGQHEHPSAIVPYPVPCVDANRRGSIYSY